MFTLIIIIMIIMINMTISSPAILSEKTNKLGVCKTCVVRGMKFKFMLEIHSLFF